MANNYGTYGNETTNESYGRSARFEWWINSQSTEGNYTEIGWQVVGAGSYTSGYVMSGPFDLWIAGEEFKNEDRIEFRIDTVAMSGTKKIYHNPNGTGSFAASLAAAIYAFDYNVSFSDTSWDLPAIPRAPSYTSKNASNITEHSVRLTAVIDTKTLSITGGGWDLSTDGGSTWTYYSGDVTDKTITGLNPGTKYWYRGYVETSGGHTNSSWSNFTTKDCVFKEKISGTWKSCVPYIKVNGTWKKAIPYIKVNGSWKEGIN